MDRPWHPMASHGMARGSSPLRAGPPFGTGKSGRWPPSRARNPTAWTCGFSSTRPDLRTAARAQGRETPGCCNRGPCHRARGPRSRKSHRCGQGPSQSREETTGVRREKARDPLLPLFSSPGPARPRPRPRPWPWPPTCRPPFESLLLNGHDLTGRLGQDDAHDN